MDLVYAYHQSRVLAIGQMELGGTVRWTHAFGQGPTGPAFVKDLTFQGHDAFIFSDHLGTPFGYFKPGTGEVSYTPFNPWGELLATHPDRGPPWAVQGAVATVGFQLATDPVFSLPPLGLAGHVYDAETGLIHMHHRAYIPRLGHFLTPDYRAPDIYDVSTFTEAYAYASGNPIMYWDPNGLDIGNVGYGLKYLFGGEALGNVELMLRSALDTGQEWGYETLAMMSDLVHVGIDVAMGGEHQFEMLSSMGKAALSRSAAGQSAGSQIAENFAAMGRALWEVPIGIVQDFASGDPERIGRALFEVEFGLANTALAGAGPNLTRQTLMEALQRPVSSYVPSQVKSLPQQLRGRFGRPQKRRPEGAPAGYMYSSSGRSETPGPIHFTSDSDPFFKNISNRADIDPDGYFDVVAHGSPHLIEVYTSKGAVLVNHRIAARLIQQLDGYKRGQNIRLLSCSTGACASGFAQNLANKLKVKVKAPNDLIWAYSNGRTVVAPMGTNGLPDLAKIGRMDVFIPKTVL